MAIDWVKVRWFTPQEFACKCGKCGGLADVKPDLVYALDELRERVGRPLKITSGFRCPQHPAEATKSKPGAHAQGTAADIATVGGDFKYRLKQAAYALGFVGIGDAEHFTHLDVGHEHAARPANWNY